MAQRGRNPNFKTRFANSPPRKPRGGMGWLFLFALGAGILCIYVFAPDLPRKLLGGASTPNQLGDEPLASQNQEASVVSRDVEIASRTLSSAVDDLETTQQAPPKEIQAPVVKSLESQFKDAAKRSGSEEEVARVQEEIKEETVQEKKAAAPPVAANGDIAYADAEFDKAIEMYAPCPSHARHPRARCPLQKDPGSLHQRDECVRRRG